MSWSTRYPDVRRRLAFALITLCLAAILLVAWPFVTAYNAEAVARRHDSGGSAACLRALLRIGCMIGGPGLLLTGVLDFAMALGRRSEGRWQRRVKRREAWLGVLLFLSPFVLPLLFWRAIYADIGPNAGLVDPVPWWVCCLNIGVPPLLLIAGIGYSLKHIRREGVCAECGYDLTGNRSGRCPECGTPIPGATSETKPPRPADEAKP